MCNAALWSRLTVCKANLEQHGQASQCLMRHHFHLVLETPRPNLVVGMKWLLGTYN
jgi:hypothetical protein